MAINKRVPSGARIIRNSCAPGARKMSAGAKERKQAAEQALIKLSDKGWPGFPKELSRTKLAMMIMGKGVTPYQNYHTIEKLLQDLMDHNRTFNFPGAKR